MRTAHVSHSVCRVVALRVTLVLADSMAGLTIDWVGSTSINGRYCSCCVIHARADCCQCDTVSRVFGVNWHHQCLHASTTVSCLELRALAWERPGFRPTRRDLYMRALDSVLIHLEREHGVTNLNELVALTKDFVITEFIPYREGSLRASMPDDRTADQRCRAIHLQRLIIVTGIAHLRDNDPTGATPNRSALLLPRCAPMHFPFVMHGGHRSDAQRSLLGEFEDTWSNSNHMYEVPMID